MMDIDFLKPGDVACLVAPARGISQEIARYAVEFWASKGITLEVGKSVTQFHHQFSGTEAQRIADMQWAIEHPEAKAIFCARGGYGSIRIVDEINWLDYIKKPKLLVGFSDITVLINDLWEQLMFPSVHAPMPINYPKLEKKSLEALSDILLGNKLPDIEGTKGVIGQGTGTLKGGNLSVLCSTLGSKSFPRLSNCILYLEDLDEYLYHVDRMLYGLKRAGKLNGIRGVLAGNFTDMHDNETPFGSDIYQILTHHFGTDIPIAFDAPIGHQNDALPLIHGAVVELTVTSNNWKLTWLNTMK